jgi:hypothetical protein
MHPALHAAVAIPFTVLGVTSVHASSEARAVASGCNRPLYSTRHVARPRRCFAVQGDAAVHNQLKFRYILLCTLHPPRLQLLSLLFFYKPPFGSRFCSAREQPDTAALTSHRRLQRGRASSPHQANERKPGLGADVSAEKIVAPGAGKVLPPIFFPIVAPLRPQAVGVQVQTTNRNLNVLPSRK